jgi:hypothetical protein
MISDINLDLQITLSSVFFMYVNAIFFENIFGKYLKYSKLPEINNDLSLLSVVYHFLMIYLQRYGILYFDVVFSFVFFLLLLRYSYPVAVNLVLMLVLRSINPDNYNYIFYAIFLLIIAIAFRVIIIRYSRDKDEKIH